MKEFKLENSTKIESGFKVPEAYFDTFAHNVMQKLPVADTTVISLFQKRKIALALIIPIINAPAPLAKEIDSATLENYLSYQTNINQYDLINALDEEDINTIKTNVAIEQNNIENKTIEDILVTNGNLEHLLLE
jgi:hypothetical protein